MSNPPPPPAGSPGAPIVTVTSPDDMGAPTDTVVMEPAGGEPTMAASTPEEVAGLEVDVAPSEAPDWEELTDDVSSAEKWVASCG